MKKISMFLMAAAMVMFVACGGDKKEGTCDGASEGTETTTTNSASASSGSSAVDKYLSLVDQMIPLMEDLKKGDAAAVEKYTKLTEEIGVLGQSTELQNELTNPEVAKKFQDAMQKLADASK